MKKAVKIFLYVLRFIVHILGALLLGAVLLTLWGDRGLVFAAISLVLLLITVPLIIGSVLFRIDMYGFPKQKRAIVLAGVGTVLIAFFLAGTVALSGETESPLSFFSPEGEEVSFYTYKYIMPIDQLLRDPRAFVAVVEPLGRSPVSAMASEEWSGFGVSDDVEYKENRVFTPVRVRVVEALKGELPPEIVVWEERGAPARFAVDSSDPIMRLGEKGLLIFAKYDNAWSAIVFAPIDDVGRIPSLGTTVEELHQFYRSAWPTKWGYVCCQSLFWRAAGNMAHWR